MIAPFLKSGSLSRNSISAIFQTSVVAISVFLVYRIVVRNAGLEQLGLWSLLMAGSTLARAGDISGAGGLGRFIAMIGAGHDVGGGVREITHTIVITSIAINSAIAGLLFLFAPYLLSLALPEDMVAVASLLVPFFVGTIVLGGLASAITAGIDGTQRIDHRAAVVSFSAFLMLLAAAILIPIYGVIGFAVAHIFSQSLTILIGWAVLHRHVPEIGWLPCHWSLRAFRASVSFGVKLNVISLLTLFFEPLVKFSFNATGGPVQVAYYELASRVIMQIRGVVVAASVPLVPAIAGLRAGEWSRRDQLLNKTIKATSIASIFTAAAALCLTPLVSIIILGSISKQLMYLAIPLIFAWSVHLPSVPFYLAAQTDGRMRWNVLSHLLTALIVVIGAVLFSLEWVDSLAMFLVVGILLSAVTVLAGNIPMLNLYTVATNSISVLLISSAAIFFLCVITWVGLGAVFE